MTRPRERAARERGRRIYGRPGNGSGNRTPLRVCSGVLFLFACGGEGRSNSPDAEKGRRGARLERRRPATFGAGRGNLAGALIPPPIRVHGAAGSLAGSLHGAYGDDTRFGHFGGRAHDRLPLRGLPERRSARSALPSVDCGVLRRRRRRDAPHSGGHGPGAAPAGGARGARSNIGSGVHARPRRPHLRTGRRAALQHDRRQAAAVVRGPAHDGDAAPGVPLCVCRPAGAELPSQARSTARNSCRR